MDLGLVGRQPREDAADAERLIAELGAHPVFAGGGRVALVEDEVEHLEHRAEPGLAFVAARHLERHMRIGQRLLGAHDALLDRRLGHEIGPRDLGRGEAADEPQRQGAARLGRSAPDDRR